MHTRPRPRRRLVPAESGDGLIALLVPSARVTAGRHHALAVLGVAIAAISWGAILVRWSDAPPVVAAFYRVLFTTLPLIPFAIWRYRHAFARMGGRDLAAAVLAGVALALHFAAWFESLSWTSVATSVTFVQAQPLFVALGAWLLLDERIPRLAWVGIVVAVLGMGAMSLGDLLGGVFVGDRPLYGNGLALCGAAMMAAYLLVGRSTRQRVALIPYVVFVYGICAIVLGLLVAVGGHPFAGYPRREWTLFAGLAVGPGLLGHTLINWTLAHLRSSVVSVTILGEPIGAAILAAVLLSEWPTTYTVGGAAIVLGGIYLTARARRGETPSPT